MASSDQQKGRVILDESELHVIRHALLMGLGSYGEIERLIDASKVAALCESPFPKEAIPLHPTGDAGTIGKFAFALSLVNPE